MRTIALEFAYYTDVIEVPSSVANKIKKVQREFDKWLYDKSNEHGCWVRENGKKKGVSFDSLDFVNYINTHVLIHSDVKARIVQKNLSITPPNMLVLFF